MKRYKAVPAALLAAVVFAASAFPAAFAAGEARQPTVSPWAQEEVARASALGIIPDAAIENYTLPITRRQYVGVAMAFVALQQRCDPESLGGMVEMYLSEKTDDGYFVKDAFNDSDTGASLAYYLGLVQGRGNGVFDPQGKITRQEAAVILTRAYELCGGVLAGKTAKTGFTDEKEIADWAKASASALVSWTVMEDAQDGSFSPLGNVTVEQCVVSFLRLYEKGAVSRKNGNVVPVFTYEEALEYVAKKSNSAYEKLRLEGPEATFVRVDLSGMMRAVSSFWLVYPGGGVRSVEPGVLNTSYGFTPRQELENLHFSQDGKTLYYTVTLTEDVAAYHINPDGELLYAKGIYRVAVDVETGESQVQRDPLPK